VSMIPCEKCGTKYNDAVMESCWLCRGTGFETPSDRDLGAAQNPETSGPGVRAADDRVLTSTTSEIVGYRVVESLGVVFGTSSTVNKSSDKGGKLGGGWANTQDGRMAYAVEEATERMQDNARRRNANAIVGVSIAVNESEGSGIASMRSTGAVVSGTAVSVVLIEEDEVTSLE